MKSAGSPGAKNSVSSQADKPVTIADNAPARFAFFHHTPRMNGTMIAASPRMFASSMRSNTTWIFSATTMATTPHTGIDVRATIRPSRSEGLRLTSGSTLLAIMLAQPRSALSAELMMAASSAPTKIATATGCMCSIASDGMTDSGSASPGIDTLAMMPRVTGIMPNTR